jgi:hypothetical protein
LLACCRDGSRRDGAWPAAAGRGLSLRQGLGALRCQTVGLLHTHCVPFPPFSRVRARRGLSDTDRTPAGRHVSVSIRATTRAGPCSLRRARWG